MTQSRAPLIRKLVWLLVVLTLFAGILVYQRHYILHHLPLIQAELAVADRRGPVLWEEIGTPPGAKLYTQVEKKTLSEGRRSMWRGTPTAVRWTAAWDVPGEPDGVMAWYRQHLLAAGWMVYHERIPSTLEDLYWKEKWLLTIGKSATFVTDNPPHLRVEVELNWDYWNRLDQSSDRKP